MNFTVISVKIKSILPHSDVPLFICCNNDHKVVGLYLAETKHRRPSYQNIVTQVQLNNIIVYKLHKLNCKRKILSYPGT